LQTAESCNAQHHAGMFDADKLEHTRKQIRKDARDLERTE
jgi:hypothetical protein